MPPSLHNVARIIELTPAQHMRKIYKDAVIIAAWAMADTYERENIDGTTERVPTSLAIETMQMVINKASPKADTIHRIDVKHLLDLEPGALDSVEALADASAKIASLMLNGELGLGETKLALDAIERVARFVFAKEVTHNEQWLEARKIIDAQVTDATNDDPDRPTISWGRKWAGAQTRADDETTTKAANGTKATASLKPNGNGSNGLANGSSNGAKASAVAPPDDENEEPFEL